LPHSISVNETKLSDDINDGFVKIDGYEIFRADRNRAGGGVALYIKTAINANLYETRFNSRWSRSNMLGN
jgi:hypothetical protein